MTLILNVLHKDWSLIAADQRAFTIGADAVVNNYRKISVHQKGQLAIGIAGQTQEHEYAYEIDLSVGVDEVILKIRQHMDKFLRVHDRVGLATLTEVRQNQSIVSFFDEDARHFFTNEFLFSPIQSNTRLHRGRKEGAQLICIGSGAASLRKYIGIQEIDSFVASIDSPSKPESCFSWIKAAFEKVSALDHEVGHAPLFAVATRDSPRFRSVTLD